ncbi:MAG: 2-oxoacid:ferredoxin oxidoreductase subunit beta, partial [Planctomycetota bacterium]
PEVVQLGGAIKEDDLLFHDEKSPEPTLAYLLSRMRHPEFPEPLGVLRCVERPLYEDDMNRQITEAKAKRGEGDLSKLFRSAETWTVT